MIQILSILEAAIAITAVGTLVVGVWMVAAKIGRPKTRMSAGDGGNFDPS